MNMVRDRIVKPGTRLLSRKTPSALIVVSLAVLVAHSYAEEITLVEAGASSYAIVVPDGTAIDVPAPTAFAILRNDDAATQRSYVGLPARLLQSVLRKSTGVVLPIARESEAPDGPAIFLGRTEAAVRAGIPFDRMKGIYCVSVQRVHGRNLFLAGNDRPNRTWARGRGTYGTLKAVTDFLEQRVGARFVLPGEAGVAAPRRRKITVPADLDRLSKPNLVYNIARSQTLVYDIANNHFSSSDIYKTYGGHSYYAAVPKAKYAETRPEYFALIGNIRQTQNNHLCVSNAEVQQLMLDEMLKHLDDGYSWVQLAQTDGYVPCECDKCNAIHPDPGERLWIVHRDLAWRLKDLRPGKKVAILAYGPTADPPRTFGRFPDNVMIELCRYRAEHFEAWKPFADSFLAYVYNWGLYQTLGYLPKLTPQFCADQARLFVENNVLGVYKCEFGESFGLEGPNYYIWGRMFADPAQNPDLLLREYCESAFGAAALPMLGFYEELYQRLGIHVANYETDPATGRPRLMVPGTPEDLITAIFPPKLILSMEAKLDLAKEVARDPDVRTRLALVDLEFRHLKIMSRGYYAYQNYRMNPSWNTFDVLAEAVTSRERYVDERFGEGDAARPIPGLFCVFPKESKAFFARGGRSGATLGAPWNWNVDLLRRKNVLPGKDSKRLRVPRIEGAIEMDGRLSEDFWKQTAAETLGEVSLGELLDDTEFIVGYDDRAIYFGFRCSMTHPFAEPLRPVGHDGKAWYQECVEIFIDPIGLRRHYYQFIFNPIPNSSFDARYGFVDDPLHPDYNELDPSWDGEWVYSAHVDEANKVWTAEVRIPFETLNVPPPQPGVRWHMNVGREHIVPSPGDFRGKYNELSLWSPNLETRKFGAPHAFGEVLFE